MITYRCLQPFDIGVVEREQNVIHKFGPRLRVTPAPHFDGCDRQN